MPTPRFPRPSPQGTPWVSRLGLMVLFWLIIATLTAVPPFLGRRTDWWDPSLKPVVIAIHIYASTLSIPFILAKIWGTLGLQWGAPPNRTAPMIDRAASIVMMLFVVALYVSGLLLTWYGAPFGNAFLKDVHLYTTLAAVAPLTWHLYRRFTQSWRLVGRLSVGRRPGSWNARLYSRRAVLALAAALGLSWATRSLIPAGATEDPNDFPVTNYGPPAGSIQMASWRLEISGAVEQPMSLTYEELLRFPRERHRYPLDCVTGWTATRTWEGIPINTILDLVKPLNPGGSLRFLSTTGYEVVMSARRHQRTGAMLATHVEGVPFTHDHGFPIRLMVPGVVGEDNVKWLKSVRVM